MPSQKERSDATKLRLLSAFRTAVITHGYAATTTWMVLEATGLSKGAMYHHFRGKAEMMAALYAKESGGAFARAEEKAGNQGPALSRLTSLYLAWMQEAAEPSVSKILFEIGPSALGPSQAREIENQITLRAVEALLEEARDRGAIQPIDVPLMAAMLNGLVEQAALHRLRTGKDTTQTLAMTLEAVLGAIRLEGAKD